MAVIALMTTEAEAAEGDISEHHLPWYWLDCKASNRLVSACYLSGSANSLVGITCVVVFASDIGGGDSEAIA